MRSPAEALTDLLNRVFAMDKRMDAIAAADDTGTVTVSREVFDKVQVGKVYLFNGRKGRVMEKLQSSGQKSAVGLMMGGNPMIRVKWKE